MVVSVMSVDFESLIHSLGEMGDGHSGVAQVWHWRAMLGWCAWLPSEPSFCKVPCKPLI